MQGIALALVDDQPLFLDGVRIKLSSVHGLRIAATGTCAKDIVTIAERDKPDAIVLDIGIPGDVFGAIAHVCKGALRTKVLVFTGAIGIGPAIRALEAGATGYILKRGSPNELVTALDAVLRGETFITPSFASQVITSLRSASIRKLAAEAVRLSVRENQIVRLLLLGQSNKEIAKRLAISEKTVKYYMTMLMQKLNVRSRLEVVIAAQKFTGESVPREHFDSSAH